MRTTRLLVFAATAVASVACGGSSGGSSGGTLAKLAITDAKTLFIAGASQSGQALQQALLATSSSSAVTASPTLYKITADDQVLEVTQTCTDSSGKAEQCTVELTPQAIYAAGPNYVYISFGSEEVLARKSDGAVFRATAFGNPQPTPSAAMNLGLVGAATMQADALGNVYFMGSANTLGVVKIDVQNPANITGSIVTPATDSVGSFLVDGGGNIWYVGATAKIRFASGSYTYPPPGTSPSAVWVGADGYFYAFEHNSGAAQAYRIVITGTTVSSEPLGEPIADGNCMLCGLDDSLFVLGSKLLLVTPGPIAGSPSSQSRVVDVENPASPLFYSASCVGSRPVASLQALWFITPQAGGGNGLGRWTPATDTCSQLVSAAQYDIVSFTVGADDVAQFTATRMSDGTKVLGKVDASGTIIILDQGSLGNVISLQQIE